MADKALAALLALKEGTRQTVPVEPETRYARSGDVNVAYQVVGEGPLPLGVPPAR